MISLFSDTVCRSKEDADEAVAEYGENFLSDGKQFVRTSTV